MMGRQFELFAKAGPIERLEKNDESARRISQYLTSRCKHPVKIVFTDNRSTMISVNRSPACRVRLHHMFADAPEEILNALAVYIRWPKHRASNAKISRYVRNKGHMIKPAPVVELETETDCRHHNLKQIYDKLNKKYFEGTLKKPITWGKPFRGRRRRSIRFGYVDNDAGVIRINPSLDAEFVPEYFIEYIVYHEMLHCLIDAKVSPAGRMLAHHSGFRKREKEYERYREAVKWQDENFYRFLKK